MTITTSVSSDESDANEYASYDEADDVNDNEADGEEKADNIVSDEHISKQQQPKRRSSVLLPKPRAKLDSKRILGPSGFRVLLTHGTKIKLQGKSHEAEDLKQLIAFYKDWAHGLFPKYPFLDVVKTVEKKCHSRTIHIWMEKWFGEWKRGIPLTELSLSHSILPPLIQNMEPNTLLSMGNQPMSSVQPQTVTEGTAQTLMPSQWALIEERKARALQKLEEAKKARQEQEQEQLLDEQQASTPISSFRAKINPIKDDSDDEFPLHFN